MFNRKPNFDLLETFSLYKYKTKVTAGYGFTICFGIVK